MVLPPLFYVLTLVHMLPYTALRWDILLQCEIQVNLAVSTHHVTFRKNTGHMFQLKLNNFKQLHQHIFLAVSLASINYSVHQYTQVSTFSPHQYISHHIFLICVFFIYYRISNRIKTLQYKMLVLLYLHLFDTPVIQLQYLCMHVTSKNFISNYQLHIIYFIDLKLYILGMVYLSHYMCIVACEGCDVKPEVPL